MKKNNMLSKFGKKQVILVVLFCGLLMTLALYGTTDRFLKSAPSAVLLLLILPSFFGAANVLVNFKKNNAKNSS